MAISITKTEKIPAAACRFAATVEIGDNGEDAKTAPFKLVARTGDPIFSPYWEMPIINDFAGMQHKSRIIADWCHDDNEQVGFINRIDASSGDLICSGALTPVEPDDWATKIIKKSRAGIPYEASIDWRGDSMVEELPQGMQATVNGRTVSGPMLIIRQWRLRAVAICPHGQDPNTSAQFVDGDTVNISFIKTTPEQSTPNGDKKMSEKATPVETEVKTEVVETAVDKDKKVETEVKPEVVKTTETSAETSAETHDAVVETQTTEVETSTVEVEQKEVLGESATPGSRFLEVFGDKGGVYFAKGMSFEAALLEHMQQLSAENIELKQRMQASRGAEPVSFSESPDAHCEQSGITDAVNKMTAKGVPSAVAQLAAALDLRQKKRVK